MTRNSLCSHIIDNNIICSFTPGRCEFFCPVSHGPRNVFHVGQNITLIYHIENKLIRPSKQDFFGLGKRYVFQRLEDKYFEGLGDGHISKNNVTMVHRNKGEIIALYIFHDENRSTTL